VISAKRTNTVSYSVSALVSFAMLRRVRNCSGIIIIIIIIIKH